MNENYMDKKSLVFLCGAKDFHAMDKYRLTKKYFDGDVILVTDTIEGEEQKSLIDSGDQVHHLFIVDRLLFKKQSRVGHVWRNIVKLVLIPIQVRKLKAFYRNNPGYIYHAIPMYYMLLCYIAKIPFVGTPQGSEILVRPKQSKWYKKNAIKVLKAARYVIVDSQRMKKEIEVMSGVKAVVLKNGFNTSEILSLPYCAEKKHKILSIRALRNLYRINEIIEVRNQTLPKTPITMVYPAWDEKYKRASQALLKPFDKNLGRLERKELYEVLRNTLLVVSIPKSDSSPRSVYEAIFAGAIVAAAYSEYIDELPESMKERIFIVDLKKNNWLVEAMEYAINKSSEPFEPCNRALEICDEKRTITRVINTIYECR